MEYTFIVYRTEHPKPHEFDMLLIENLNQGMSALKNVIGPSLLNGVLDPHALFETQKRGNVIIPSAIQVFRNPVLIGNKVFHNMVDTLNKKKEKIIMNSKGGHQTLLPDMGSIGWTEVRREKRNNISFNKYPAS